MSAAFQLPELEHPPAPAPPRVAQTEPVIDLAAERAAVLEAARCEGHAEGLEQGRDQARAELASAVAALESAVRQVTEARDALCERVEPAAIELALAGAEQVVGAALDVQPELIKNAASGALRRLVDRDQITMLVHPDDLELMRGFAAELVDQLGGIEALDVQAERRVHAGGVIVSTPTGDIDARVDTRLDQLTTVVREALAR